MTLSKWYDSVKVGDKCDRLTLLGNEKKLQRRTVKCTNRTLECSGEVRRKEASVSSVREDCPGVT